jgi:flagellar M-ring protein FliF
MAVGRIRELWRSLEPRGQFTIAGIGLLVVATFYFLFQFASTQSYTTLVAGVDANRVGQMTKALDAAGVTYRIASGGTEIDVASAQTSKANIALAAKGLTTGGQVGMEIFDKTSFAMTDFQQKVNYQRAVGGEIARAIEQIDGITSANVQLVLPDDTLFVDQGPKASAAVLLTTTGSLDPSTVSGIAHLVAAAIKGLDTASVTITDATGALLWPNPSQTGGLTATSKLAAEQIYAARLGAQIASMLDLTIGPGKALARVQADLNVDQTTLDRITYAKKGTPITTQTQQETLQSKGGGTVAPTGSSTKTPAYSATSAGTNSSSNYENQTGSTSFGVDRTIQKTTVAPGAVNRLSVALLIDSSVPKAEVASLRKSAASLAGIVPSRGDTLSVSTMEFAKPAAAVKSADAGGPGGLMANPLGLAKGALLGLASIVFLFFMSRLLKRREREGVAAEPTWLREISRAVPVGELGAGRVQRELNTAATTRQAELKAEAGEIARQQPEQVAVQVGQWLKE